MNVESNTLLHVLREPGHLANLQEQEWDSLLVQARQTGLLARLGCWMEQAGTWDACPPRAQDNIRGSRAYVEYLQLQIRHELNEVRKALRHSGAPLLLLKGAAYIMANLPTYPGRSLSDLDLLLPREQLATVEASLQAQGWESDTEDEYDQRYYREWMHEIPPLKHRNRSVEVDIHHNLLPLTGRYRVDAGRLWEQARPIDGSDLYVLSPADMVLHSAAHLFVSDELRGGLRDLVDIHLLCGHFSESEPDFFPNLLQRARELDLSRPLFYALQSAKRLLGTPLPRGLSGRAGFDGAPNPLLERLMGGLVTRVLAPHPPGQPGPAVAQWLLYIRSHWIRMPPRMLAGHLLRKSLRTGGTRV